MRDEIKLTLPTSWEPNRDEFLSTLGVGRAGLGELLFGNVYDALFVGSIDVKADYRKYYSVEYPSFLEYVDIRYGEALEEEALDADRVFLVTWLPQVIDTNYDGNVLDTVLEHITKLEAAQNEN